MQYTPHYNMKLPEGTDIVNPLIQDNPNYTAIDTALYNNKLRVVGTATHVKAGTDHAITLVDSDINQFKFVATGDYVTGDTFTVDGVTVTPRLADGTSPKNGAFKINSTVLCILDGTLLNLIGISGEVGQIPASDVILSNGKDVDSELVRGSVPVTADGVKTHQELFNELANAANFSKLTLNSKVTIGSIVFTISAMGSSPRFACTESGSAAYIRVSVIRISSNINNCFYTQNQISTGGSITDQTNIAPSSGTVITLHY